MKKIVTSSEFFNVKDTLECGQVFRFVPYKQGFKVFCLDRCAYCYNVNDTAVIECNDNDESFFVNYFDLEKDYSDMYRSAISYGSEVLTLSAKLGKGIRILNQSPYETLVSFMVSQNNNIPRIKASIEKLCNAFGEEKFFNGERYYAFPTVQALKKADVDFYKSIGLGYRAEYVYALVNKLCSGYNLDELKNLSTDALKKELLKIYGVGPKVADCVSFFGYKKTDSFPVDTWIEKVYRENFGGTLLSREKIANYFVGLFKEYSGYFQQYLFYYKRSIEKNGQIK